MKKSQTRVGQFFTRDVVSVLVSSKERKKAWAGNQGRAPKTVVARCMYRLYRVLPATGSWSLTSSHRV
jgi:hypothetical protein